MHSRTLPILLVALIFVFWSSLAQAQKVFWAWSSQAQVQDKIFNASAALKTVNIASTQFQETSDGQNFRYRLDSMSSSIVYPLESDAIFMAQITLPDNSRIFSFTFRYFNQEILFPEETPHFYIMRSPLLLPANGILAHLKDTTTDRGLHKAMYSPSTPLLIDNTQHLYFLVARLPTSNTGFLAASIRYR